MDKCVIRYDPETLRVLPDGSARLAFSPSRRRVYDCDDRETLWEAVGFSSIRWHGFLQTYGLVDPYDSKDDPHDPYDNVEYQWQYCSNNHGCERPPTLERSGPPCGCGSTTYALYEKALFGDYNDDDAECLRAWASLDCADIYSPIYTGYCKSCRVSPVFYHIECESFMACVSMHKWDTDCPFCDQGPVGGTGSCDLYALSYMVDEEHHDLAKYLTYLGLDQYFPWPVAMTIVRCLFCSAFLKVYDTDVINYHASINGPGITGYDGGAGPDFACLKCRSTFHPQDK